MKLVIISPTLDLHKLHYDLNIHSECGLRKFLQENESLFDRLEVVYLGLDSQLVLQEEIDFIEIVRGKGLKLQLVYMQGLDEGGLDRMALHLRAEEGQYLCVHLSLEAANVLQYHSSLTRFQESLRLTYLVGSPATLWSTS